MSAFDVLIAVAMLVGLVGTVLPVLPGLVLIMGAALVWAVWGDAGVLGWGVALVIVGLGAVGIAATYIVPARRASAAGAPGWVLVVGAAGVVAGFFLIPVVGALVGGPIAILAAELVRLRDLGEAWRSTGEALKGVGIGIGIQLGAGVAMVGLWVVAVLVL
ncbi:MAG: DUF456 domain-containing protein [Thermoleophilia bacterium]|nr:DUF456 domain-containing protein [Thermoleophilia bacterium]